MKFVVINPQDRTVETVECTDLPVAMERAGLKQVDFGALGPGIGYVVYEFGLFVPPAEQFYFAIGRSLVAGPCVLFGVDEDGETVDLMRSQAPPVLFFRGVDEVEAAMAAGQLHRPEMRINNELIWAWPNPAPAGMKR